MTLNVYITGSGHSGSTLLDRLLGAHPDISALGEIHRYSLGLHRFEMPFRCDCGETVLDCPFWTAVRNDILASTGQSEAAFLATFQTTDHATLAQASGERYFSTSKQYRHLPRQIDKYAMAAVPSALMGGADRLGLLGTQLDRARASHVLFEAARRVSGRSVVVDSTKNPVRMRALYQTSPHPMRIIYLKRDGRAVTNSRIKRQGVTMAKAARAWMSENKKVQLMLRRMPSAEVQSVQYEDLCRDPETVTAQIFRSMGVAERAVSLDEELHSVGSNLSRFEQIANEISNMVSVTGSQKKLKHLSGSWIHTTFKRAIGNTKHSPWRFQILNLQYRFSQLLASRLFA